MALALCLVCLLFLYLFLHKVQLVHVRVVYVKLVLFWARLQHCQCPRLVKGGHVLIVVDQLFRVEHLLIDRKHREVEVILAVRNDEQPGTHVTIRWQHHPYHLFLFGHGLVDVVHGLLWLLWMLLILVNVHFADDFEVHLLGLLLAG